MNSNFEKNATATAPKTDNNQNKRQGEHRAYCYAGVEFRPLQITDDSAVSTPILSPTKNNSSRAGVKPQGEIFAYEEVQIPSGNFDKINPENILVNKNKTSASPMNNSALAAFTSDMDDTTQDNDGGSQTVATSHPSGKKPPPMPKPYFKSKEGVDVPDAGKKRTPPPLPKPYNTRTEKEENDGPNRPAGILLTNAIIIVCCV